MLRPEQKETLLTPSVRRLFEVIAGGGGEARLVGGAVRDVVLGRPVRDRDLATTLPPDRVMELLIAQGIKVVPTGLAHGTVTAILDRMGYEITTLRRDVTTDGRRATVAFTDDWRADAARRDFTLNALYVDAAGNLTDYFEGIADARAGQIRFIGAASARIQEDVLRILRFFRFYAWFGAGEPDADALTSCRALAPLIPRLSFERIGREVLKLLAAPSPLSAWRLMHEGDILPFFAEEAQNLGRLESLLETEKAINEPPCALSRLAALLPEEEGAAEQVAGRLKLSNRETEQLKALAVLPILIRADPSSQGIRKLVYRYGCQKMRSAVLLEPSGVQESLEIVAAWEGAVFPLKGRDLLAFGIPATPRLGEILKDIETWWIEGDFRATRDACLKKAAALVV